MSAPGLIACGFAIQRSRLAASLGSTPAAMVERLARWVRSGAVRPNWAGVPRTVWHPAQTHPVTS